MERVHFVASLDHQQAVLGQLAQEVREQADSVVVAKLQNELALAADDFVRRSNFLALELVNEKRFEEAYTWLTKAMRVAEGGQGVVFFEPHSVLRRKSLAAVHNNFGLFYFTRHEFRAAYKALSQAVDLEEELGSAVADNRGATLMNLAQTEMALHAMGGAEHTLLRAIQALETQLTECIVTVQIANTGLLVSRAYYLLAQCREHDGRYSLAADAAQRGLQMHKSLEVDIYRVASGQHGPQRKPQLVLDLELLFYRCSEKEQVFPKLLRPSSAKLAVSSARSRSTPLVVTSLTEPVPRQPAAPAPRTLPQAAVGRLRASSRPVSAHLRQSPAPSAPEPEPRTLPAFYPTPEEVSSASRSPNTDAPVTTGDSAAAKPFLPKGEERRDDDAFVESARLKCQRRKPAPPATRQMFRTSAVGLERVYGSLSEKHRAAFDNLCATRRAPVTSSTSTVIASSVALAPPPPTGAPPAIAASGHNHGNNKPQQHQAVSITPRENALSPPQSVRREESDGPPHVEVALKKPRPQGSRSPAPKSSAAPAGGPHGNRSPATALVPVTVRGIEHLSAASGGGAGVGGNGNPLAARHDPLQAAARLKACTTIQRWWRRSRSRLASQAFIEARHRRNAEVRCAIRLEEEERAMAMANRIIEDHQRQIAAQRMLLSDIHVASRHSHLQSDSQSLLPSAELLSSSAAVLGHAKPDDVNNPATSSSDVDSKVPSALTMLLTRQQIRDSQQKVVDSTHEALVRAHAARQSKRAEKKRSASRTLQFVLGCLSARVTHARQIAKRNELLDQLGLRARQRIAGRTLVRILRSCVENTRELEAKRRFEEQQAAVFGISLLRLSQFCAAKWSAVHAARLSTSRTVGAAKRLQRVVRAFSCRKKQCVLYSRKQKELRALRYRSACVIQRAFMLFMGRISRHARWAAIRCGNFCNKTSYAATMIQRAWRWHTRGRQTAKECKARRRDLAKTQQMRLKHDQLIQELVTATEIIQRFYRGHLGRRQRDHRKELRGKSAHNYILREWLLQAVKVLQRFCPMVLAKRQVRIRREMKLYILDAISRNERRIRSHLFPAEWGKYDAALDLLQRVGRGSLVRRAYRRFRILSVAAHEGRLAGQSLLVRFTTKLAADTKQIPEPEPAAAEDGSRSPPAGDLLPATMEAEESSEEEQPSAQQRKQQFGMVQPMNNETIAHQNRKYRKSKKLQKSNVAQSKPMLSETVYAQWSQREISAKRILVSFFRRVVATKNRTARAAEVNMSIVRYEATVYIQSAWRGYLVRARELPKKKAMRENALKLQLREESAQAIQQTFRRHCANTPREKEHPDC